MAIRKNILVFIIILLWAGIHQLSAQTYRFIDYRKQNLFDQSQITALYQDSKGFLWIGTANGLYRYDSEKWLHLTMEDRLPDNQVNVITEDDSARLWVGTAYGIVCINQSDENEPRVADSSFCFLFPHNVYAIRYWNHYLWISTSKAGTFVLKDNRIRPVSSHPLFSPQHAIFDFLPLNNERLMMVIPDSGIFIINTNLETIATYKQFPEDEPVSACVPGNGDIIVGGKKNLYRLSPESGEIRKILSPALESAQPYFYDVRIDHDGVIWAASNRGLFRSDSSGTELITTENGLPNNLIKRLLVDNENNLWIGSYSAGLYKLTDRNMLAYRVENGLVSGVVNALLAETADRYLAGSDAGVFKIENYRLSRDKRFRRLDDEVIWVIRRDRRGRIWFGGEELISYFDRGRLYYEPFPEVSRGRTIMDIYADSKGRIWCGADDALLMYDGKSWKIIEAAAGSPMRSVVAIAEDRDERLLFASGEGLIIRTGEHYEIVNAITGLPARSVYEIFQDRDTLWLGCDRGLIKMVGNTFRLFGREAGLRGLVVTQIMQDNSGALWLCTENGLHRFENDQTTLWLNSHDGLVGDEFTTRNASAIDARGRLWLGLFGGLNIISPEKVMEWKAADPKIRISKAVAYESIERQRHFSRSGDAVIPYNENNVIFEFGGLFFRNETDLSFRYKMEPMEQGWSHIGRAGDVRYHSLWPGLYTVKVQGVIENRPVGEVVSLTFTIDHPFWMETWFMVLAGLGILAVIYLILYYRTNKLRRQQEMLESLVKTRTRELEKTKAQIENIIEHAGSAIVTVNIDGIISTWNQRAEQVFGFTKSEIVGKNIGALDIPGYFLPFSDILQETQNSGVLNQLELKKQKKDGSEAELVITCSHLIDEDAFTIVMEDFTERNRLIEHVMNREKLLGAISALNKLLATLSHYINNALMAITGMSQLSKLDKKYIKRFMETTDQQSLRIQAVIKSLSDLVHSLNLKTRHYVGEESQLFDIEAEIEEYIIMLREGLSDPNTLDIPGPDQADYNDVY